MNATHELLLQRVIETLLDIEVHGRHARALGGTIDMLIKLHQDLKRELSQPSQGEDVAS